MSYWLWSNLSQHSDAELEEHKTIIRKVIEITRKMAYGRGAWFFSQPNNTISDLENQIIEIDKELERRKSSGSLLLQNGGFLLLEDGGHLQLEQQVTVPQEQDGTKNQIVEKDKEIKVLRKRIEEQSKEIQEERNARDKLERLVENHRCDDSTFFSDVEKEDE